MMRFLLALTFLTWGASASATTVRSYTEEEMVQVARAIVRGKVEQVESRIGKNGMIVTDVTIKVDRALKGAKDGERVVMTQLGGTYGGKTLNVSGKNTYKVGEEVLVFLEAGGGGLVELALGAGKYVVTRTGEVPMVERKVGRLTFVRNGAIKPAPVQSGPEPLSALEARIEAALGQKAGQ